MATDWRWPPDRAVHGDVELAEVGVEPPHDLPRLGFHLGFVHEAEAVHQLAAKEQVGRGIKVVRQRKRLVDRLDVQRAGIAGILDLDLLPVDQDLARCPSDRPPTGT
jgi:hypothetical protein